MVLQDEDKQTKNTINKKQHIPEGIWAQSQPTENERLEVVGSGSSPNALFMFLGIQLS